MPLLSISLNEIFYEKRKKKKQRGSCRGKYFTGRIRNLSSLLCLYAQEQESDSDVHNNHLVMNDYCYFVSPLHLLCLLFLYEKTKSLLVRWTWKSTLYCIPPTPLPATFTHVFTEMTDYKMEDIDSKHLPYFFYGGTSQKSFRAIYYVRKCYRKVFTCNIEHTLLCACVLYFYIVCPTTGFTSVHNKTREKFSSEEWW